MTQHVLETSGQRAERAEGMHAADVMESWKQRAERAEALLQFVTDGIVAYDDAGVIRSFSAAAEDIFGYAAADLVGQSVAELLPDEEQLPNEDGDISFGSWAELALGSPHPVLFRHRNGTMIPVKIAANELYWDGQHLFVAAIHDVTREYVAQKQLTETLARAEAIRERFELCVEGSEAGIWDIDLMGGTSFFSSRLWQLLGYSNGEYDNSLDHLRDIMHPADALEFRDRMERALNGAQLSFDSIVRLRAKNGEYLWFHSKGALRRDEHGVPIRAAGSITEITARVQAEEELRRHRDQLAELVEAQTRDITSSQARLVAAINAISDGFCLLDENEQIVLVNEHMKEMHKEVRDGIAPGRNLQDLITKLIEERAANDGEARDWEQHFSRVRSGAAEDELELPDGRWVKIARARVPDGGLIVLHSDITRYKEQEARLIEQADELAQALDKEKELNNLQRQFVSMASHEFRTPLAIIDGSAQLLARDTKDLPTDKPGRRIEKIRSAVTRMTYLIESTLTAARLDAGKIQINPQRCDLRLLITEVCERQQELASHHVITVDLSEMSGNVVVDIKAMDQVFTNLMSNAVKYSPDSPNIYVRGWEEGEHMHLSVRDEGLGMSESDLQRLFTRFFRAETSTGIAGTGIGLNLVRDLVQMHEGTIQVESRVGEGSTFTVRLPINGPTPPTDAEFAETDPAGTNI